MADEYYTPVSLFANLGLTFDIDVAAPKGGIHYIPAIKHYSIEDDGLAQPWTGRVWMNPPYSNSTPWVDKFIEHGNGIALVPMSKSRWFTSIWNNADGVVPMPYNTKFMLPDGSYKSVFIPTMLFAIGESNKEALLRLKYGWVR